MFYDELNYSINSGASDNIYILNRWQEFLCEEASYSLENFSEDDWKKLYQELPKKSIIWLRRLAECLNKFEDENQLKLFSYLSYIDDVPLFTILLCQILAYDLEDVKKYIDQTSNPDYIYEKAEKYKPLADKFYLVNYELILGLKEKAIITM